MTPRDPSPTAAYGVLTEPATLRIQGLLPGTIDRVWAYLTDSTLRRQWLAAGDMQLEAGSGFEFVWRNDSLSDPPSPRPAGFAEEQRMACRIVAVDPPRRLVITWQGSGDVSFELQPQGDSVLLTLTHARLPGRPTLLKVSAGWHMHLDLLLACTSGTPKPPFWPGWQRLHQDYEQRLPV